MDEMRWDGEESEAREASDGVRGCEADLKVGGNLAGQQEGAGSGRRAAVSTVRQQGKEGGGCGALAPIWPPLHETCVRCSGRTAKIRFLSACAEALLLIPA